MLLIVAARAIWRARKSRLTSTKTVIMNMIVKSTIIRAAATAAVAALLSLPSASFADALDSLDGGKAFTAHRIASTDPNHKNADYRRIEPGQTLELGDIHGAGKVTHMWFTINAESPNYLQELDSASVLGRGATAGNRMPTGRFLCSWFWQNDAV